MKSVLDLNKIHERFRLFVGDNHTCLPENYILKGGCSGM